MFRGLPLEDLEYDTGTTLDFWRDLSRSCKFLDTNIEYAKKGMKIRRLFLIAKNNNEPKQSKIDILNSHLLAMNEVNTQPDNFNYVVKVSEKDMPDKDKNDLDLHVGIIKVNKKVDTVFKPTYKPLPNGTRELQGMLFTRESAMLLSMHFNYYWNNKSIPLEDYIKPLQNL